MCPGYTFALAAMMVTGLAAPAVSAGDPKSWFDEALRQDLGIGNDAARLAFASYRRAAEAGLPEAEFNVAVMLDSGRGVERDVAQAATWYARAAARRNQRAVYNLGQLYEAGEGVPRNTGLARAWFEACELPAARDHLAALPAAWSRPGPLSKPAPVIPASGSTVSLQNGGIELVWTAKEQPEPVRYFVEIRLQSASGWEEIFSDFIDTSSVLAAVWQPGQGYAWRVFAISPKTRRYLASDWLRFSVAAPE